MSVEQVSYSKPNYPGPFLKWIIQDLKQMDLGKRKLMTMRKALQPRYNVDRQFISKKRRRKTTCQHWSYCWRIDTTTRRLRWKAPRKTDYRHQKQYWQHEDQPNGNNQKKKMGRKQPRGPIKRFIRDVSHEKTWTWLKKGNFTRETEFLQIAAQNSAL